MTPSVLPLSQRDRRRNFVLGILNGVVFNTANVFIDNDMVIAWFLVQLGVANAVIGLVGPARQFCWLIPQIFISSYLQRQRHKLPVYRSVSALRVGAVAAMALTVALIPPASGWLVPTLLACLLVYSLGTSVGSISFMAMLDQVIAPGRRGRFFGLRLFLGGILSLGASALVGALLEEPDGLRFPYNFAAIFAVGSALMAVALGAWSLLREPPDEDAAPDRVPWRAQIRRGVRLLRGNVPYRTFALGRLALMLGQIALPFYIVYAKEVLGIPVRMVSVYLTARTAASIVSNLIWGRVGDRYGNRRLIRVTNLVGLAMPLTVLAIGVVGRGAPGARGELSYAFTLVFIAFGMFAAGSGIANANYVLDLAPPGQKPLYLGFTNTLAGAGIFATALGGWIVDWAGFDAVMAISAGCYAAAFLLSLRMIEPREGLEIPSP